MEGILTLVSSRFASAFETPMRVTFGDLPRVGQSFTFEAPSYGPCHTSYVKAIDSETGALLLTTRNSLYKLELTEAR